MKALLEWVKLNRVRSTAFAIFVVATSVTIAIMDEWFWWGVLLMSVVSGVVLGRIYRDCSKFGLVALLALLVAGPGPARAGEDYPVPPPDGAGGCAAAVCGGVVIVFGAVVIYKLTKFCQKHFPKSTAEAPPPPPPPPTNSVPGVTNKLFLDWETAVQYAASFPWGNLGSCPQHCSDQQLIPGPDEFANTVTASLCIRVSEGPNNTPILTHTMSTTPGRLGAQAWADYVAEIGKLGLVVTDVPSQPTFSLSGKPISAEQSPISLLADHSIRVTRTGRALYRVQVWRSPDLVQWTELLATEVESGSILVIQDTESRGRQFYQFTAALAD